MAEHRGLVHHEGRAFSSQALSIQPSAASVSPSPAKAQAKNVGATYSVRALAAQLLDDAAALLASPGRTVGQASQPR